MTGRGLDDWPHTKRALPWALVAFLAMVWLVPFDSVSLPVSLPLDAGLDRPFLVLIAALWLLSLASPTGKSRLSLSPVHWALLVLLLVAILSIFLNASTIVRLNEFDLALRKLALLFSYALLFVVVASSVRPSEVRNLTVFMVGLAAITSLGALIEYRTGYNAFFSWTAGLVAVELPSELGSVDSIGREALVGPTIHPLAVAMMMALALPFAVMGFLGSPERRTKVLYAIAAGLMVAAALATQRKTAVVAPAVGILVVLAYRPRQAVRLLPTAVVLMVLINLAAPGAMAGVVDQLKPSNLFGVLSTKDRQSDYAAITPDVLNNPLLGRGYESYDQKKYRILDNQYLSLVIGVGAFGVLAYLAFFATVLRLAHRVARTADPERAPPAIAAAAGMASLVVGSALLDTFALPQLPYLICFLAGLVAVSARELAPARRSARARVGLARSPSVLLAPRSVPE